MESVLVVYRTDNWHSYNSRDIIAIATSSEKAISLCKEKAKAEGFKISGDTLFELTNYNQTQSYKGEGEFVIEELDLNILF